MQQVSNILPSLLNDNAKTLPIEKRKSVQILLPSAFSAFCGVVYSAAVDAKKANLLILAKANKESKKKLDSVRLARSLICSIHSLQLLEPILNRCLYGMKALQSRNLKFDL